MVLEPRRPTPRKRPRGPVDADQAVEIGQRIVHNGAGRKCGTPGPAAAQAISGPSARRPPRWKACTAMRPATVETGNGSQTVPARQ
jgi:hypothetical protein